MDFKTPIAITQAINNIFNFFNYLVVIVPLYLIHPKVENHPPLNIKMDNILCFI